MKYAIYTLAAALCAGTLLAGCNTIAGAGQDIQNAGQGIHNSAEKHKPKGD